jgi:transmembrane sensor
MTDHTPIDSLLLDRYLAGALAGEERARVEKWLRASPRAEHLLRELPHATRGVAFTGDTDASWATLSARLAAVDAVDDLANRRARNASDTRRRPFWRRGAMQAAAALLVVTAGAAVWRSRDAGGQLDAPLGHDITASLPDGTRITLAAGSRASWSGSFGSRTRDVVLDGQGLFDVVHDAARPFRVHTRNAIAEDVGTRFMVRAWPEMAAVEVAVEQGIVALADSARVHAGRGTLLHAGQRGNLLAGDSVLVTDDADAALAWTRGELVFDNRPLTEVLPAVSRRFDVDLRADSALSHRRVTARFAAQTLDQVMNALAVSLDVRVETRGRTITLTPVLR